MRMGTVQNFGDTPALLAAHMGAGRRFSRSRLRRGGRVLRRGLCAARRFRRVTLRAVLVDAACHLGIAVLAMFMGAGGPLAARSVAAGSVMDRVMRTQAAVRLLRGKGRGREQREQQAQAHKRRGQSFFHTLLSSFTDPSFFRSLYLMHSTVMTTAAVKAVTPTST